MKQHRLVGEVCAAFLVFAAHNAAADDRPPAENVALSLGWSWMIASKCGRPTAPVEGLLDRYVSKTGIGPLEARRLQERMLSIDKTYREHTTCDDPDKQIAGWVSTARKAGNF